ncbi:MAG: hypothetical protein ACREFC_13160 [Stellaceae bacterium]
MSNDTKKLKEAAMACLGADKPASKLADWINSAFEDVRAYAEEDDLVIRGGDRYLVVKRIGPDRFHVAENVAIPSTNLVDFGDGIERDLDHLLNEIVELPN